MEVRERISRHMVGVPFFGREDTYRLDGLGTKFGGMRWKGIILGVYPRACCPGPRKRSGNSRAVFSPL